MSSVQQLLPHAFAGDLRASPGARPDGPALALGLEKLARSAGAVMPALQAAADRTGVDFTFLFHTARLESSFRPDAKAATSSATGLFQFIDSTWLSTLRKHGAAHGIHPNSREEALKLRTNPAVSSLMAAEHAAENAIRMQDGLGRKPTASDLYMAHFLGGGGAVRFLQGLATNPAMAAAEMLPAAARANKAIFFKDGAPRSLQGVHDLLSTRFHNGGPAASSGDAGRGTAQSSAKTASGHPFLERLTLAAAAVGGVGRAAEGAMDPQAGGNSAVNLHGVANSAVDQRSLVNGAVDLRSLANSVVDPRRAAQAAYLLLAELGV